MKIFFSKCEIFAIPVMIPETADGLHFISIDTLHGRNDNLHKF